MVEILDTEDVADLESRHVVGEDCPARCCILQEELRSPAANEADFDRRHVGRIRHQEPIGGIRLPGVHDEADPVKAANAAGDRGILIGREGNIRNESRADRGSNCLRADEWPPRIY